MKMDNRRKALLVMAKGLSHGFGQRHFSRMSKWCVPEIMSKTDCLYQVFIKTKRLGNRTCILTYLQGVGQTCPVMITVWSKL